MPRKSAAKSPRHSESFYRRLLARVHAGASLPEVAREAGVKPATLEWWKYEIRRRDNDKPAPLLPVVFTSQAQEAPPSALEIHLAGVRLAVRPGFDEETLQRLLGVLESRRC